MSDNKKNYNWAVITDEYVKAIKFNAYYEYFWSIVYVSGLVHLLFFARDAQVTAVALLAAVILHHMLSTFIAARNAYLVLDAFAHKKDEQD